MADAFNPFGDFFSPKKPTEEEQAALAAKPSMAPIPQELNKQSRPSLQEASGPGAPEVDIEPGVEGETYKEELEYKPEDTSYLRFSAAGGGRGGPAGVPSVAIGGRTNYAEVGGVDQYNQAFVQAPEEEVGAAYAAKSATADAIAEEAKNKAVEAQKLSSLAGEQQRREEERAQRLEDQVNEYRSRADAAADELQARGTYWASPVNIVAGLAAAVSPIFSGKPAEGEAVLNGIINKDLELQKQKYEALKGKAEASNTTFGMLRQAYGDERIAEEAYRATTYRALASKAEAVALRAKVPETKAQALALAASMNSQAKQLQAKTHSAMYERAMMAPAPLAAVIKGDSEQRFYGKQASEPVPGNMQGQPTSPTQQEQASADAGLVKGEEWRSLPAFQNPKLAAVAEKNPSVAKAFSALKQAPQSKQKQAQSVGGAADVAARAEALLGEKLPAERLKKAVEAMRGGKSVEEAAAQAVADYKSVANTPQGQVAKRVNSDIMDDVKRNKRSDEVANMAIDAMAAKEVGGGWKMVDGKRTLDIPSNKRDDFYRKKDQYLKEVDKEILSRQEKADPRFAAKLGGLRDAQTNVAKLKASGMTDEELRTVMAGGSIQKWGGDRLANVAAKMGITTKDKTEAELANQIASMAQAYRKSISGAALTDAERAEFAAMLNSPAKVQAKLDDQHNELMRTWDSLFEQNKFGNSDYDQALRARANILRQGHLSGYQKAKHYTVPGEVGKKDGKK